MNINQLKYFVAVADYRSFSKAAEQYFLTQTAVTQQIRKLEETVGAQLIDRKTRPISVTPMGQVFLKEVRRILMQMDTAVQRTREASTGITGTLRIGYTNGYEHSDLTVKLRRFHQNFPNILITCHRCNTDILAAELVSGEYDIIFTWDSTNVCNDESVEYRLQERVRLVVAMYASHPLAHSTGLTRADLKNEINLFMSPSSTGDSLADEYFIRLYQKAGYYPNILLRSSDVESILMMVSAEEGISVLPVSCIRRLSEVDNLVFVPLVGEDEVEEILAVWRKDNQSPSLRHFLQMLE
ncbi:MAG TPA: LysR family transcriptional regulator [Lachnospiraceae bacterium]|nr:LysR family transcriptional regulator [Lachnospiraceae bacterium]